MKFLVFSDLHYDTIPDGNRRLVELLDRCCREQVDFVVELGDLCYPKEENRKILRVFEESGISCCFSLGNHETAHGTAETILDFFGLKRSYYSVKHGNVKLIFLDANQREPGTRRKPYLPGEQLDWLREELAEEEYGCIICTHQSLVNDFVALDRPRGIVNRAEIRQVLEEQNAAKGNILFCMNGHDHGTAVKEIHGIWYYGMNSSSYIWQSVKEVFAFDREIHEKYPYLKNMILYREPLYAVVTVDGEWNISIQGMEGHYLNVTPQEVGIGDSWNGVSIRPRTASLEIKRSKE